MKKVLRFLACALIAFAVVWLSGYGNLMNDISESLSVATFFGAVAVLAVISFVILEMYISFRRKINDLTDRIEELESRKDKNDPDRT